MFLLRRPLGVWSVVGLWLLCCSRGQGAEALLLPVEGLSSAGPWHLAQNVTTIPVPLVAGRAITLAIRCGVIGRPVELRAIGASGILQLSLTALDERDRESTLGDDGAPLPDSCVRVHLTGNGEYLFDGLYFIRPHPHWYEGEDRQRLLAGYANLPSATTSTLRLTLEQSGDRLQVWLDDRYVGETQLEGQVHAELTLQPGQAVQEQAEIRPAAQWPWLPVDLRGYHRPGCLQELPTGEAAELVARGGDWHGLPVSEAWVDVGVSRWLAEQTGPEEFTDNYYTRGALDRRPEDILLAVPTDDYVCAHLLCLVQPDADKTPVLTLRLTRFLKDYWDSGGRGTAIADSSVRLVKQDGQWPAGCRELGQLTVQTDRGSRQVPLLQVAIPLHSGHIQDVLEERGLFYGRWPQSLDLELTKELHLARTANHGASSIKPLGPPSSVQVLGLVLERAPVKVRLRSVQAGNVFYADEGPCLSVEMTNRAGSAFTGELSCDLTDAYGTTTSRRLPILLPVEGERPVTVRLPAPSSPLGHYHAALRLTDTQGQTVWDTETTLAVLPRATRQPSDLAASRLGVWWFRSSHIGTDRVAEIAPLMERLGWRYVTPSGSMTEAAELARHGLGVSMAPDFCRLGSQGTVVLDQYLAAYPDVDWALIFHETSFGEQLEFPPEFLGQPAPKLSPAQQARFDELRERAIAYARHIRERHPGVKTILGNGSLGFAVEFMRQGFPHDLVDAWGDEDLGQTIPPEAPPGAFKSLFWMREYARLYGYEQPVTACYEWRGRPTRPGDLTELEQAQYCARDLLQGLAFGLPTMTCGLLHDVGDSYYYSRWGSSGLLHRYPLLNPKPSYVAVATLTRELSGARFRRIMPVACPSINALEFTRGNNYIYALWLPRGEREMTLTTADETTLVVTDWNGNTRELKADGRAVQLTVSASPCYLRSSLPVEIARAGPTRCETPPPDRLVVDPLTIPGTWEVETEPDEQLESVHFDFPRRRAEAAVEVVTDGDGEPALKLTLQPQPQVPWPVGRYVALRCRRPQPVPGRPTHLGLWVKGNSCWGRVLWELRDSNNERFISLGAPCGGWSVGDWKARTFINFDGWNYLQVGLPWRYASGFGGPDNCEWTCEGGDGVVDYPVRLTRLVIELRDRVVRQTETVTVPDPTVSLRHLCVSH